MPEHGFYRDRIYGAYASARELPLAPSSLAGLNPHLPYLRRLIQQHFPKDRQSVILDVGCGHGALLYALREAGYVHARGVNGSAEQAQAAKRLGIAGVEREKAMPALASIVDASLDVVVAFDVIEHFTKDELVSLIDEVRRVLHPAGYWILHVSDGESPFFARIRYGDFTHEQAFTRISLDQLLRAIGLRSVACFEDRPVPHGVLSVIREELWSLIRWGLLGYIAVETGIWDRRAVFSQNLLAVASLKGGYRWS